MGVSVAKVTSAAYDLRKAWLELVGSTNMATPGQDSAAREHIGTWESGSAHGYGNRSMRERGARKREACRLTATRRNAAPRSCVFVRARGQSGGAREINMAAACRDLAFLCPRFRLHRFPIVLSLFFHATVERIVVQPRDATADWTPTVVRSQPAIPSAFPLERERDGAHPTEPSYDRSHTCAPVTLAYIGCF